MKDNNSKNAIAKNSNKMQANIQATFDAANNNQVLQQPIKHLEQANPTLQLMTREEIKTKLAQCAVLTAQENKLLDKSLEKIVNSITEESNRLMQSFNSNTFRNNQNNILYSLEAATKIIAPTIQLLQRYNNSENKTLHTNVYTNRNIHTKNLAGESFSSNNSNNNYHTVTRTPTSLEGISFWNKVMVVLGLKRHPLETTVIKYSVPETYIALNEKCYPNNKIEASDGGKNNSHNRLASKETVGSTMWISEEDQTKDAYVYTKYNRLELNNSIIDETSDDNNINSSALLNLQVSGDRASLSSHNGVSISIGTTNSEYSIVENFSPEGQKIAELSSLELEQVLLSLYNQRDDLLRISLSLESLLPKIEYIIQQLDNLTVFLGELSSTHNIEVVAVERSLGASEQEIIEDTSFILHRYMEQTLEHKNILQLFYSSWLIVGENNKKLELLANQNIDAITAISTL